MNSELTALEVQLHFYVVTLMSRENEKGKPSIVQNAVNSATPGLVVWRKRRLRMRTQTLLRSSHCGVAIQHYLRFTTAITKYQVISHRANGFVSVEKEHSSFEAGRPFQG